MRIIVYIIKDQVQRLFFNFIKLYKSSFPLQGQSTLQGFFIGKGTVMAWYHQYQHAEVTDPLYPLLRGKALPILRYEIRDLHILKVQLLIQPGMSEWFKVPQQVRLYKGGCDLIKVPEIRQMSESKFQVFLKRLNLKRW